MSFPKQEGSSKNFLTDEFTELRNTLKDAICGEEKLRIELEKERKKSRKLKNAFKR